MLVSNIDFKCWFKKCHIHKILVSRVDLSKCWFNSIDVSLLMTCQWLSLIHWPTVLFILIKVQDFHQSSQKFQCSVFIIDQDFYQSSSFSSKFKFFIKVQVFHQSSSFSSKFKFFIKVQVFHQSSSFSSKFTKCWFQMLISKNVKFTKYWL